MMRAGPSKRYLGKDDQGIRRLKGYTCLASSDLWLMYNCITVRVVLVCSLRTSLCEEGGERFSTFQARMSDESTVTYSKFQIGEIGIARFRAGAG